MHPIRKSLTSLLLAMSICACGGSGAGQVSPGGPPPMAPSAQPNVSLLAAPLDMPGLNRQRQIRLYLPPDYATSGKRYPVLYMHDGQNLFDAATSYAGEWEVDETMNALSKAGQLDLIVVGVDNGGAKRMTELDPWDNPTYGKAEGEQYMEFVVKVVKPLIDATYRTLPERANTGVMGSSMGGFISHYAIERYPEVFSKAGLFSPSYWVNDTQMFDLVTSHPAPKDTRIYMLMGGSEGGPMVPDAQRMASLLKQSGHPEANLTLKITPGGTHSETFWRGEFRQAVLWMFAK